jgi:bla regulator protein blaR1
LPIQATLPGGTTSAQFLLMIQSLLEERFHLRAHRETKELPAYELAVGKDGPRFHPIAAGEAPRRAAGMTAEAARTVWRDPRCTMERLRSMLARSLHAPVVDRTGLTATYDLELTWTAEGRPLSEDPWPMRAALRDQLGLTLQPRRAPVETLVVDHVDRTPTGN